MEAPKKIYIDDPTGEFDDHWRIYQNNDSVEYTRTDAFIEKACKLLENTDFCKYYNKEFIDEFRRKMEE